MHTEQIWQKFHNFFSPHKIDKNFKSFCPRHKSRKFLQVFVPLRKLRDKIFWPQKYTSRIITGGGDVPPPPPVTKRIIRHTTCVCVCLCVCVSVGVYVLMCAHMCGFLCVWNHNRLLVSRLTDYHRRDSYRQILGEAPSSLSLNFQP